MIAIVDKNRMRGLLNWVFDKILYTAVSYLYVKILLIFREHVVQQVGKIPFIVIRHRKENRKKCSLRGLEGRSDILFFEYPACVDLLPNLEQTILLDIDAEPLSSNDSGPFILLDGTWRYASIMKKQIPHLKVCKRRKIPDIWRTAYPRKQSEWVDPEQGLATVEAIYAASFITNTPMEGILDYYYWKEDFLEKN